VKRKARSRSKKQMRKGYRLAFKSGEHAKVISCEVVRCTEEEKITCGNFSNPNLLHFCKGRGFETLPPIKPPIFNEVKKVSCTRVAGLSHHSGEYDLYMEKLHVEFSVKQKSTNDCNIGGGVNDFIAFVREDDTEYLAWGEKPPRTVVSCSILYHSRSGSYQFDLLRNEEYVQNELFTEEEVEKICEILESIRD